MTAYRDDAPRRSIDELVQLAMIVSISVDAESYAVEELEELLHRTRRMAGEHLRILLRGTRALPQATLERLALIGEPRLMLEV